MPHRLEYIFAEAIGRLGRALVNGGARLGSLTRDRHGPDLGSTINFHPHVHAIVSRGGWTSTGQWVAVPWIDPKAAELLFRHKLLSMLRREGLIDEQRVALLLSWKHSGFSIHNSVTIQPEAPGATERLVRYVMRGPVSQERIELDPNLAQVTLRPRAGTDDQQAQEEVERLDPDEVVARIIAQIPEPRKHLIHSYGRYANAARAKRRREAAAEGASLSASAATATVPSQPDSAERKAARKRWANLIRHIYEVDPLVWPRCGGMMKIIAFITDPRVIRSILDSVRPSAPPSAAGSRHPPPPARPAADGGH